MAPEQVWTPWTRGKKSLALRSIEKHSLKSSPYINYFFIASVVVVFAVVVVVVIIVVVIFVE